MIWTMIALSGIFFLVRAADVFWSDEAAERKETLRQNITGYLQEKSVEHIWPDLVFPAKGDESLESFSEYLVKQAYRAVPLYGFTQKFLLAQTEYEHASAYERILAQEAKDENFVDAQTGKLISAGESTAGGDATGEYAAGESTAGGDAMGEEESGEDSMPDSAVETAALPVKRGISYTAEQLTDFDFLLNTFYTVDASTAVSKEVLDVSKLLEKEMEIDVTGEGPEILIYHTHSQEGFADSVPGDLYTGIVGVGAYLKEVLEGQYGYEVLHVTDVFDMADGQEDRNNAYTLAEEKIRQVLASYPSIQVVIDLHRDGVEEGTHLAAMIDGKETAQFMFFNGLSYSKKNGAISYLPNPYIEDNLALALQLQLKAAEYYPGVTRKIYLKTYRYNMHLCPKTVLVECGAQTNTFQEAKNAMEPLASVLHMVLKGG